MLGLFLGAPWLIGPILGTLSLFIFFLLLREIYPDRRTWYLGCVLLLLSPFFLFMSSNYMNHSSTMFFVVLFLYGYQRMFTSPSSLFPLLAGFSLGYALTIRPLDACAIGLPFICVMLVSTYKNRTPGMKKLLIFFSMVFLFICALLLYNTLTNGHPLLFGYAKKYASMGFLGAAQTGAPHTIKWGIVNTSNNLVALNYGIFEWPVPSLIFIFMLFAIPVKKNRWDYLCTAAFISLVAGYFFYYYQDLCFGPRFYYSALPFLIILTVRGVLALPEWLHNKGFDRRRAEATLYLLLLLCFLFMFSFSLPSLIRKYSNDYWWVTDKIHKAVRAQGIYNAIVFIDVWYPPGITEPNLISYGSGFQFNSPDLRDDVIYALDLREKNPELMQAFPGRYYYLCKIQKPMSEFTLLKLTE
jgi:4-amino-4-deoxy-L-arabinose transferase-like glycosyltransferase